MSETYDFNVAIANALRRNAALEVNFLHLESQLNETNLLIEALQSINSEALREIIESLERKAEYLIAEIENAIDMYYS